MTEFLEIPMDQLTEDALAGLIDEFVSREGTDYGHGEHTLEKKAASVRRQLETGRAAIVYDPSTGSCNIVPREDMKKS